MKWAAVTGIALLVSGCAGTSNAGIDRSSSASAGATGTGGDSLVLRTTTSGGFAGLGGPGTVPDFSLYGDGRAIVRGTGASMGLTEYHLTRQALRRLVSAASAAGLATPHTVDDPRVADATYKTITFVTAGRARTTKIAVEVGGSDAAHAFLTRLNPASWPRTDLTAAPHAYRPDRIAVLALPAAGDGEQWPFGSLAAGDRAGTRTCTVLSGTDAQKAMRLAARPGQWRDRSTGRVYRVTVRPLLPDESGCGALSR